MKNEVDKIKNSSQIILDFAKVLLEKELLVHITVSSDDDQKIYITSNVSNVNILTILHNSIGLLLQKNVEKEEPPQVEE